MRIGWLLPLALSLSIGGCCGKEKGRVPFSAPGSAHASLPLEAGEVSFWTDIDIEYEGPASLGYVVELEQAGAVVASTRCDPLAHLSVKTGWVETNLGNSHSRSGAGKMDCSVTLPTSGATTVRATLAFGTPPAKHTLVKADLVVKQ